MLTANFRDDVVYAIAYKMGLDPTINLQDNEATSYASYINTWIRRVYPNFDWPEWTFIEQRTPDASHYVDPNEIPLQVIGRVWEVYLADPQTQDQILDIPFKLNERGIWCGFEHGTHVWVKFTQPAPQFTSEVYSNTHTYHLGDLAYWSAGGDCYRSLQNGNVGHAVSDPAWWSIVEFPLEIADLVVRGAYSDALREDGQHDKANAEEQAVLTEIQLKQQAITSNAYNKLTDQARPAPNYHVPGLTGG